MVKAAPTSPHSSPKTSGALAVVILAAGKGVRMKSALPKVMHPVGGRPMLAHVLDVARALGATRTIVVRAADAEPVVDLARHWDAEIVVQDPPLGTGHAVLAAEGRLADFDGNLLVLFGDTPLITPEALKPLLDHLARDADLAALGFRPDDPTGYGRMVTDSERVVKIVEHKDASDHERHTHTLCFAGMLAGRAKLIFDLLHGIGTRNAQGEYYLTDIIGAAHERGLVCMTVEAPADEVAGVNSRAQLAQAEAGFQTRKRAALMEAGVNMLDPATVYFCADTIVEPDASIGPFVVFGPGVRVRARAEVRAFCHIEGADIGEGAIVGPFARLRPGAVLAEAVHVGNFVEVKNTTIAKGAKANHLTYLGDASVGANSNIGAGAITCNYDGVNKHKTEIGEGVFIGSDATLVAPVKIGDGAYVAAGSTVTENVDADALVFGRARQSAKPGRAKAMRTRMKPKEHK
jgi:bifunctional UDP-N-acetylglucosamine pyrophosphorylase/glucosamine-1-phosphate N-acetyltransferase